MLPVPLQVCYKLRAERQSTADSPHRRRSASFSKKISSPTENLIQSQQRQVQTPENLLHKNTPLFCLRIVLAIAIICGALACMLSASPFLFLLGLFVQGAMYVHLIELQHSVLHLHAFENHKVNRCVGFLLGLPMLISFSDFQYRHLRHHKYLGTALNSETFSYQHNELGSVGGFLKAMFDYSRWRTIGERIFRAYSNPSQKISDGLNPLMENRIRAEYQIFGAAIVVMLTISILTASIWPLVLWLSPLIAAEPVHFLLELPEHLGLKAHSNPNVFENTRSWGGSLFARWYSHNTNYHLAHHFNQLVPMHNLPKLQVLLEPHIPETSRSKSYPDFFIEVIRGQIKASSGD